MNFRKNMTSKEYWMVRAEKWDRKLLGLENKETKKLQAIYKSSFDEIHKELLAFFDKYATENNITLAEARKQLTPIEMADYQKSIVALKEIYKDTQSQYVLNEIQLLSARRDITRLEALLAAVNVELCKSSHNVQMSLLDMLTGVYTDTYNDAAALLGGTPLVLPTGAIEHMVDYPWSGKMFSERIWDNKRALISKIKEDLVKGMIKGESTQKIAKKFREDLNVLQYQAERLVRTETNYCYNHAHKEVYKACGVEKYEYLAIVDSRTSSVCLQHNGQVYLIDHSRVGDNYPPLHPNCRSTVMPYKDEWN